MKKYLPARFRDIEVPSFLRAATGRMERLLPSSVPKTAGQLPLPGTPFDHYRRNKLIELLEFHRYVGGNSVLEIGCGMGDLLKVMHQFGPKELYGVDSSKEALAFARQYLDGLDIDLTVADPRRLPFPDKSFDMVMVMYELQHIADEKTMQRVVNEAARVSRQWIILVEETAPNTYMKENVIRRPVAFYKEVFKKANENSDLLRDTKDRAYHLRKTDFLHVGTSQYVFTGSSNPWHWLRWALSPLLYLMGFPASYMKPPMAASDLPTSEWALKLQKYALPFTTSLDNIYKSNDGTTVMWFERERLFRRG